MTKKVVCTECGTAFSLDDNEGVYTPESCPSCGKTITKVIATTKARDYTAFVEE